MVTGAAISPDRTKVVLRTYSDAFEWTIQGGDIAGTITKSPPRITALPNEPWGEAITYDAEGKNFLTVSDVGQLGESHPKPEILSYVPNTEVYKAPGTDTPGKVAAPAKKGVVVLARLQHQAALHAHRRGRVVRAPAGALRRDRDLARAKATARGRGGRRGRADAHDALSAAGVLTTRAIGQQYPGYGYPPQQPGYGYPQQQPPQHNHNRATAIPTRAMASSNSPAMATPPQQPYPEQYPPQGYPDQAMARATADVWA
jgi:hypothetical protein